MKKQRSKNTQSELRVRQALHRAGFRYRLHIPVPGKPRRSIDIAFPRTKIAVFVDGCFWHGCPEHGGEALNNKDWWRNKIAQNKARDEDTSRHLVAAGWTVLRFWEHENPVEVAAAIGRQLELARFRH
ncbi:very short patch repair endonuclease [Micromonospora cathayae]|uniref:Very short patch repair endonuclease n=1 Tax=Micromonospora cathayae TaxID=3028804 RepID=A0ABY7ZP33_9ACTN|nr:very short patch repair endonuclease [Micromonospora sp. HUAS 3]WDZ84541.1 very short patch repair endonuclease [Micromonospora sp. HUAS 3]